MIAVSDARLSTFVCEVEDDPSQDVAAFETRVRLRLLRERIDRHRSRIRQMRCPSHAISR